MTIEQYIANIASIPSDDTSPRLQWFSADDPESVKEAAIQGANGLPYLEIAELEENPRELTHNGAQLCDQIVFVHIYQRLVTQTPDKQLMWLIYNVVADAHRYVDKASYRRHFISLVPSQSQPPTLDRESGGLYAYVSFRLRYYRA